MVGRLWWQISAVAALCLALCGPSQAAHFVMETEIGPQEATEAPGSSSTCTALGFADGAARVSADGQRVEVFVVTSAKIAGTNCDGETANGSSLSVANGTLESDTGEIGPVTICVSGSASQQVSSSGIDYDAASTVKTEAIVAGPGTVYEYPSTTITTEGADSDVQRLEVEAMVGDAVTAIAQAVSAAAGGDGEGSTSALNRGEVVLSIGPCAATMAPTVSPLGLVMLLAGLGAVGVVGRRRVSSRI